MSIPPGGDGPIPSWSELKFNPLGLYNLRRRIGCLRKEPGIYTEYKHRFMSADIAWFAAGASQDRSHNQSLDAFHPLFDIVREGAVGESGKALRQDFEEKIQRLTFDLATVWDRAFGGTTFILHVKGTRPPGALALPQNLKADVYLPPGLMNSNPDIHGSIAYMVQLFIEKIGVLTVERWTQFARDRGWTLNQPGNAYQPKTPHQHVPKPHPGTSHYTFHGRPYGSLRVESPTNSTSSISSSPSQMEGSIVELSNLKRLLAEYLNRQSTHETEVTALKLELQTTLENLRRLKQDNAALELHIDRLRSKAATGSTKKTQSTHFTSPTRNTPTKKSTPESLPSLSSVSSLSESPTTYISSLTPTHVGPATMKYLQSRDLLHLEAHIAIVTQFSSIMKWSKEIAQLDLEEHVLDGLLEAMNNDFITGYYLK